MSNLPAVQSGIFSRQGIESLRDRKDPEAMKVAAREMESLFAYEMIKAMRSATGTSAVGVKGFGAETYGAMFDMELARLMSLKGLGLQEMILKGMRHDAYSGQGEEKAASTEEADASSSEVLPHGSPKWYPLPPRAGAGDVSDVNKGSANGVSVVPPTVSADAEAKSPARAVNASGYEGSANGASTVVPPTVFANAEAKPPAGAENTFRSNGSAIGVFAAVPPAASAAAEARLPAPVRSARLSPPAFSPRIPDAPEKTGPITYEKGASPIREGGRANSSFGYRKDPITGKQKFHHGIDIAARTGTEIYPVKSGEVIFSGRRKGYGNIVEIDHGEGIVTRYAHNRANRVAVGDLVSSNTVIAEVGSTGRSTGPHLHFEVRSHGKNIPPQNIFPEISKGTG